MKLQGINGTEFGLKIVNYEFPELAATAYYMDWNWILVCVTGKNSFAEWKSVQAYMDTYAAQGLCKWFHSLADGQDEPLRFLDGGFMEYLFIDLADSNPQNVILNMRPLETYRFRDSWYRITTNFQVEISRINLKEAATEWDTEIQQFPTRKERPKRNKKG